MRNRELHKLVERKMKTRLASTSSKTGRDLHDVSSSDKLRALGFRHPVRHWKSRQKFRQPRMKTCEAGKHEALQTLKPEPEALGPKPLHHVLT